MKQLLVLFISILSMSSFAGKINRDSTWEDIQKSYDVVAEDSQINFNGTLVGVLDVCLLKEMTLRTKKKVSIYEWSDEVNDDLGPVIVGKDYLTTSRKYLKTYADGDETIEVLQIYPLNYSIDVYDSEDDIQFPGSELFTKNYTIPSCN